MKTVCEKDQCAGCMACIDICSQNAISIVDSLKAYNAVIDTRKCLNCNLCHKVCQKNFPAKSEHPIQWYQGWAGNDTLREKGSSGGIASAVAKSFIENGGIVWSCTFKNGEFGFENAKHLEELEKFIGSKYVKSNPQGVYKQIKTSLKEGQKILFIGLPCQVSALKNYIGEKLSDNLYTIDLICHGTPSPQVLELFLKQYGYSLRNLKNIQFRIKAKFMVYIDSKGVITNGVSDKYSIAFLNSLTYTENCYQCMYAKTDRVSDLTLGDSWGSELQSKEQKSGISLALCQTSKGMEILQEAELHLETVDVERAIQHNHQLLFSSKKPNGRDKFFSKLGKKGFNTLVFCQFPKQCLRQDIKQILIRAKIIKRNN